MLDDFKLVTHKLPEDMDHVNIYPLGDLHIGSPNFDEKSFKNWKKKVCSDKNSRVVLVGDLLDNGLKNSHTNSYEAALSPYQQKEWLKKNLANISDKIIGAVQGNHEHRSTVINDSHPLYEVLEVLGVSNVYRKNMCFVKINVGKRNTQRQCSYALVLVHGASKSKTSKFAYSIEGIDCLITGHTHSPDTSIPAKIVVDKNNETVRMRDFAHIIVPSYQSLGGYALKAMYAPQSSNSIPVLRLSGKNKHMSITWLI